MRRSLKASPLYSASFVLSTFLLGIVLAIAGFALDMHKHDMLATLALCMAGFFVFLAAAEGWLSWRSVQESEEKA